MRPQHYSLLASLAVCMLLLLSACGGPTPIAGRAAETVTPAVRSDTPASPTTVVPSTEPPESTGSPTAGVSPNPAATATEVIPTPGATPHSTDTVTPPATDTPVPDDAKPARSTETPVANIKPPEISGYSLQQEPDGGWVYKDQEDNIVAHTVTYNWKGLSSVSSQ
jgi:hypothetical protein